MNFDFFDEMSDEFVKTNAGKGIMLAGISLGILADQQRKDVNKDVSDTPLFKQMNWGKLDYRDLKRHMSRVPELIKAYNVKYAPLINALTAKGGEYLLMSDSKGMGVDGNFVFTIGFVRCNEYFWRIFKSKKTESEVSENV
jgi:hypothetical protein